MNYVGQCKARARPKDNALKNHVEAQKKKAGASTKYSRTVSLHVILTMIVTAPDIMDTMQNMNRQYAAHVKTKE